MKRRKTPGRTEESPEKAIEPGKGRLYLIEIQRKDDIDHPRRLRYYGALTDGEFLAKGKRYDELPERIHFYISEKDIWHCGKAVCPVIRQLGEKGIPYDDGVHIIYVNAEVNDGSRAAKLMKYFKTACPEDDSEGDLSRRVHYLKREEGGMDIMCEVSEKIQKRGEQIGEERGRKIGEMAGSEKKACSTARNLFQMGLSPEQIADAVGESLESVKDWLAGTEPANC